MSTSTHKMAEQILRHLRGILTAVEEWLKSQETHPPTP